jgi:hypothetical protein
MVSNGEMICTKAVVFQKIYHFVFDYVFIWNHLDSNIYFEFLAFWNFKNFQMNSDKETIKPKVVDVKKL